MAARKKSAKKGEGGPVNIGRLKSFVERIEKLEGEKAAASEDIAEVYAEAHGDGYDKKAIRRVIKERKKDQGKRQQEEAIFETYAHALGLQLDLFPSNSRTAEERV